MDRYPGAQTIPPTMWPRVEARAVSKSFLACSSAETDLRPEDALLELPFDLPFAFALLEGPNLTGREFMPALLASSASATAVLATSLSPTSALAIVLTPTSRISAPKLHVEKKLQRYVCIGFAYPLPRRSPPLIA